MEFLGSLIITLGFSSAVAYLPLQVYACLALRSVWRIVAFVPLLLMVPIFGYTAYALAQQSNLWPILLILAAPAGTGFLLILLMIQYFTYSRPLSKEPRQSART